MICIIADVINMEKYELQWICWGINEFTLIFEQAHIF